MRVLMFGWEYPPHRTGGLGTATEALVSGLVGLGIEVTLVVPFSVGGSVRTADRFRLVSSLDVAGVRRIEIDAALDPYASDRRFMEGRYLTPGAVGLAQSYGPGLLDEVDRFTAAATAIAATEPHDLIDAHDWMAFPAGMAARAVSGRPFVAHIHATEFDRSGDWVNTEIVFREREGLGSADFVIANSEAMRRQVVERYRVDPLRATVVHLGVDLSESASGARAAAPFGAGHPIVLFVGRLTRQKGPDYFLEMASQVLAFAPETRFVIAGTGDMLPGLLDRAAELELTDKMIFAGGLPHDRVVELMRSANLCVMTSVAEPFGLVALESLRAGTPCIVPRNSGVAEVVRHAMAADFWDTRELVNKVVAVVRSHALRDELSEQGSLEVSAARFSASDMARRTVDAYRLAISVPERSKSYA